MATISKHSGAKDRIMEYPFHKRAYADNGTILEDRGYGWKIHGTLKAGLDPATQFAKHKHGVKEAGTDVVLQKLKGLLGGLKNRAAFKMLYDMLGPDEVDGIWSEIQDGFSFLSLRGMSVEDIAEAAGIVKDYLAVIRARNIKKGA